jgi:hypothetical protein
MRRDGLLVRVLRRTTASCAVAEGLETVTSTAHLGRTEVLDARTLGQLSYSYTRFNGYQEDPYHLISIGGLDYFEQHPSARLQHALSARIRRSVSSEITVAIDYRFYTDDWGVDSHTAQLEIYRWRQTMATATGRAILQPVRRWLP